MSKKVAIVQSNYLPWKGYFDLINSVNEFILYDDIQYTRRDWRNRNKIKTKSGLMWLTIPVQVKGKYYQKIRETVISDPKWNRNHWEFISHNYFKAKYFCKYKELFENLYLGCQEDRLSQINYHFITEICKILGISTQISWSMNYKLVQGKTERLVDLCKQAGATEYLSGPAAKTYINDELFRREGIRLRYMDYSDYPEYHQLFPPFEHGVSIIDLIFNEGENAAKFMKSFQ
jgi:hypothetical protein